MRQKQAQYAAVSVLFFLFFGGGGLGLAVDLGIAFRRGRSFGLYPNKNERDFDGIVSYIFNHLKEAS